MKKVLASLLTAYVLTNGQAPPSGIVDQPTPITSVDVIPNAPTEPATTVSAVAQVSISSASTAPPESGAPAPPSATTAPQTTAAATTQAATTAAGTTQAGTTSAGATAPQTGIVPPTGATTAPQTTAGSAAATTALSASGTTLSGSSATTQAPGTTAGASGSATTAAPAPVTTTAAPVTTPAPVTPAPTLNQYCPINSGVQSGIQPLQNNENKVCFQPTEIATDYMGRLRCDNFACCQCAQINCGFNGYPCETLQIGDSGAVGVQSINIRGASVFNNNPMQNMFGGGFSQNGAKMECNGRESCLGTVIRTEMLSEAQCSGDMGCQGAKIVINDPLPMMNTQCNGLSSCSSADIEINVGLAELAARAPGQACNPAYSGAITELGKIEFNGQYAGANAKVSINNKGCGTLLFDAFECMSNEACPGLTVNIEGNVLIRNCDLRGTSPNAVPALVAACQAGQNLRGISPGFGVPTFPVPGQPTFPVIPPNPVNPNPNPIPVVPSPPVPVNPTPVIPGFGIRDPRATKLQCDQLGMPVMGMNIANPRACAGTTQTIQIANGFVLDCSLAGACNGMTLTLNAGRDPNNPMFPVTYIDVLKFVKATSGVTVYINNEFGASGAPVRINDIRCEMPGSCNNLKVIAGPGVDILSTNYDCSAITSCLGATVQQGTMSFPMDPRTQGMGVGASPFPQQPQTFNSFPQQQQQPAIPFNPWI